LNTDTKSAENGQRTQSALRETQSKEDRQEIRRVRWSRRWKRLKRGVKLTVILLLVVLLGFIFRNRIFVTLDSGEVLLVYYRFFGGTSHNQIGHEGLHIIAPWDKAYRYRVRTQTLVVPMTVLSKSGLEVKLDAQIRFHPIPEIVPYLHRRYGPDYVNNVVIPQLTESVQKLIGRYLPEELYSSENGASVNRIFESAKRMIGGVFFVVEDISLFNIRLPAKVQEAVQTKAEAEQISLAYTYKVQQEEKEGQRKVIEAKALQQYQDIVKGIPTSVLVWKGIEATLELAKSPNTKVIVMGSKDNLPLLLGNVPDLAVK
jgi:regulator of protease activity HflC (stomatin/prohibitin superfamily)